MIDRIEDMAIENLPPGTTTEQRVQLNMLKQLALHPELFRLVFVGPLPADLRLHAKYALINKWQNQHDILSINITEFTQELIAAIHKGTWISELKHTEEPDILLVDDLQFITGKDSTQEAFYASLLKPRLEAKKLTVLFSEYSYDMLSITLRDDLRNMLKLGFHESE